MSPQDVTDAVIDLMEKSGGMLMDVAFDDPRVAPFIKELNGATLRTELVVKHKIVVDLRPKEKKVTIFTQAAAEAMAQGDRPQEVGKAVSVVPIDPCHHTFTPPPFADQFEKILLDPKPHNIWCWGPTGCGKTAFILWLGAKLGRRVYRINCREDMESDAVLGDKTLSYQQGADGSVCSLIQFQEGQVVKAMREGLNDKGEETGAPGILYVDEAAAIPPQVGILLNRLLENDNPRRNIVLDADGGREIVSHSGFRVVFSANTQGRGANTVQEAGYTAQLQAQDVSLLNRMTCYFRFGYHKAAEKRILQEKLRNDQMVERVLKFRDAIRDAIKQGRLTTPFSTRHIVAIGDLYRVLGDLGEAVYRAVFEAVLPDELAKYNEFAYAHLGTDLLNKFQDSNFDYL